MPPEAAADQRDGSWDFASEMVSDHLGEHAFVPTMNSERFPSKGPFVTARESKARMLSYKNCTYDGQDGKL